MTANATASTPQIDIARQLAERAEDVCRHLLPNGVRRGREWKVGSVHGEAGDSLGVVLSGNKAGVGQDFATGETFDLIGLWKLVRAVGTTTAFREAEAFLGITHANGHAHARTHAQPDSTSRTRQPITPPPDTEPSHVHPQLGAPSKVWRYNDADGRAIGYVCRYEAAARKQIRPQSWTGKAWQWCAMQEPRPLYRLDEIIANPESSVLVVEGEKTADAAQTLLPDMLVTTWLGGCRADAITDFGPLGGHPLTFWPDADAPGIAAMERIAARLAQPCRMLDVDDMPDAWDAADALADGWNTERLKGWASTRVREWTPPAVVAAEPNISDDERRADGAIERSETPPLVSDYGPKPQPRPEPRDRPRFLFRIAAQFAKQPAPVRWLVRDWFEVFSLVLFFGDASSCKTWLLLGLGLHISAGRDFFGAKVLQGAVFVVCGEGFRGMSRRLASLCKHYGIELDGLPFFVSECAASFAERDSVADVITSIRTLSEQTGTRPALVIVDTLSRNFGPADENATESMSEFVRMCDWIRTEFECAVAISHHVGHADKLRARGNTTLRGALDAEFRVVRDEAGTVEVSCSKMKDAPEPAARRFTLRDVPLDWTDEDGETIHGAALVPTDAQPIAASPAVGTPGRGRNQVTARRLLAEAIQRHRSNRERGGYDPEGAAVSLTEWRDLCAAAGIDRFRFREVKNGLENIGQIRVENGFVSLGAGYL